MVTRLLKMTDCVDKEISITLVDDSEIQVINKQYLSKDRPTNVISFSLQEGQFGNINPNMLGDIIISVETANRDALKGNLSFEEELIFLIIHGLLHLLGYDHVKTSQTKARQMKRKEKELFGKIMQTDLSCPKC